MTLRELKARLETAEDIIGRVLAFGAGLVWDEWDKLQIRRASRSQSARAHQPDDQWIPLPCRCASCCEARRRILA